MKLKRGIYIMVAYGAVIVTMTVLDFFTTRDFRTGRYNFLVFASGLMALWTGLALLPGAQP